MVEENKKNKLKKGEKVASFAIWLEGGLATAKAVIGFLSGSLVLFSDAIHSGSDILSIATSWLGLKIAQKKPDQRFPYGYYKAENLGTAVISVFILYAAWQMFSQGYNRLFSLSLIKIPLLAMSVSLLDALVLFFFGNYEIKVGKKVNAQSLIAMGEENRTHLFSSTAVFIGILAAHYQIPYLEGAITIGISFLILKVGLKTIKDSVFALMDVRPDEKIEQRVVRAIESVPGVEEFFDLRLRKAGPFIFGETKVGVRKFVDVKKAYGIAQRIESKVKQKVPRVDSFTIHVEPFKSEYNHIVIPVGEKKEVDSSISPYFGRSPYFLFVNLKNKKIVGHYILENPFKDKKQRAGLDASKMLIRQKSDILITREIGEISFYTLRDNLFDIYQTKAEKVKEAVDQFNRGHLKSLQEPTKER